MNYRVIYTLIYIVDSVASSRGRWPRDIEALGIFYREQVGPTHWSTGSTTHSYT